MTLPSRGSEKGEPFRMGGANIYHSQEGWIGTIHF